MALFISPDAKPTRVVAQALIVTTLFMSTLNPSNAFSINPKVTVNITNLLDQGKPLTFHCKSKDNDLGERVLGTGQSWYFQFRRQYFFTANTLFFCRMAWPDMGPTALYVEVYNQLKDDCLQCCWNIRTTGPCLHKCDKPGTYNCVKWRKPDPPRHHDSYIQELFGS